MPHHHGPLDTRRRDHAYDVGHDVAYRVRIDRCGRTRRAVSAHVQSHGLEPSVGDRRQLVAPRIP